VESGSLIVLDTHVLLSLDRHDPSLGQNAIAIAADALAAVDLAASAITFWEVALLLRKRRLQLKLPVARWRRDFVDQGLVEIPVTGAIGIAAAGLEDFHTDPADRLIVATVQKLDATLLTADEKILAWPGRLDRRDARI
jgi:PIN domain nuclease of toxin-antitoxin system